MQVNLKQPKLNVNPMPERKTNWLNIFISLLIIVLLLFGVYLINQNIKDSDSSSNNDNSNTEVVDNTSNSQEEELSLDDTDLASDTDTDNSTDQTEDTTTNDPVNDNANDTNDTTVDDDQTSDNLTDEPATDTETEDSTTTSDLVEGEIVFTVDEITSTDGSLQTMKVNILAANVEGARVVVKGKRVTFSFNRLNLAEGETYKMKTFKEVNGQVEIDGADYSVVSPSDYS